MKYLSIVLFSSLASGLAFAAPPETFRPDRYKDLYLKSAITNEPEPIVPDDIPTDLPDWTLVAIGKTRDGAPEVRIMNMKDRSRITIPSQAATDAGFSIVKVENSRNYLKDAVVTLKKGNAEGQVLFDTTCLVLKRVAGPTGGGATPNRGNTNSKTQSRTQSGRVPPTPGNRSTTSTGTRKAGTPPTPGAIPQPTSRAATPTSSSTSRTNATNTKAKAATKSSGTATKSKRTRYVPRPK